MADKISEIHHSPHDKVMNHEWTQTTATVLGPYKLYFLWGNEEPPTTRPSRGEYSYVVRFQQDGENVEAVFVAYFTVFNAGETVHVAWKKGTPFREEERPEGPRVKFLKEYCLLIGPGDTVESVLKRQRLVRIVPFFLLALSLMLILIWVLKEKTIGQGL